MASLGHVAIGMATARYLAPPRAGLAALSARMAAWSALSMLPDADVLGLRFGVRYAAPWGHRGATHSFAFALVATGVILAFARHFERASWRLFVFVFVVLASHPILDAMTDGGLGCALYYPFSTKRHFFAIRPIPVAPIGMRFVSQRGLTVALQEFLMFAVFFVYALFPRALGRKRRG